jgi:1-acyl-sn-glycerol-3-phosphate acyltransferase
MSTHHFRSTASVVPRLPRPARPVRFIYEHVVFYVLWAIFGVLSLLWSITAAGLYVLLPRRWGVPLGRGAITAGFRLFIGAMESSGIIMCDLSALDSLRDVRSLVIAPNHPGLLDVVLIVSRLRRVTCIMKAPIRDNLFLGGGARLAGYIRNDQPINMIKTAAEEVQNGQSLLVFPEGTRSNLQSLRPFEGGIALIAKRAGAPIQTVFIENDSGFLGKGWPLFKRPPFPLVFRVRLGRRFEVTDDVRRFMADLECYYRAELNQPPTAATMPAR